MQQSDSGDLEKKDRSGNTPLHLAAQSGHMDVVKTLLGLGAPVNQKNHEGETPLHLAAGAGHKEVVRILLDSGADPTLADNNGAKASHRAAAEGFIEILDLISRRSDNEKILHQAAEKGSIKELKQLLKSKLVLDEKNERGETALYVATAKGHRRFAEMLLQAGADPNIATDAGATVLHAAAKSGLATIIKLCLSNKAINAKEEEKDPISVENNKVKKDLTLKKDPPKEWEDIYKKCEKMVLTDLDREEEELEIPIIEEYLTQMLSPLVEEEHLEEMRTTLKKMLDDLGKRMDVRDTVGRGATLLHLAAACRAEDTVRLLLKRKADPMARTEDGKTPLVVACAGGSLSIAKILVEAGADPKARDFFMATALHFAVRVRSAPITKYLLSLGVDPNAKDLKGNTPLHLASLFNAGADVIRALRDAGGDLYAKNNNRLYPCSFSTNPLTLQLLKPPGVTVHNIINPFF